ncbi:CtrA inhibitor SciP [Actibacterium pelagium]|uniref:CtrA inhibitor SciP n=1 Tax=Actibacterium pelagium TaxID=2029103 RepID=UPI000BAAAC93|nr:DUF1153 domain-containing protein [Actibacterium pelagium]
MYIKRLSGPRTVRLPDGTSMTRADLPSANTRRWVASRKAAVVKAVVSGLLSRDEALEIYAISDEEFDEWRHAIARHGIQALKVTGLQKYRQPEGE